MSMSIRTIFYTSTLIWIAITLAIVSLIFFLIYKSEKDKKIFIQKNGFIVEATPIQFRQISITQIRMLFLVDYPTEQKGQEFVLTRVSTKWAANVVAKKIKVKIKAHPESDVAIIINDKTE